jgi:hypothetical protein
MNAEVAACGRVQGIELQVIIGESLGDGADFGLGGVIKMASGGKNFDGLKAILANERQEFRCEFFGDEKKGGKDPLHGLSSVALRGESAEKRDEERAWQGLIADGGAVVARIGGATTFTGF